MERQFQRSFQDVRVHAGGQAGESARAVNALAYTVGLNIVFAPGHYNPSSAEGQKLIAHELGHVAQQRGSVAGGSLPIGPSHSSAEAEADRAADAAVQGRPVGGMSEHGPAVQKKGPLKYDLDPKVVGMILANCASGQGDPKTCAEFRATVLGDQGATTAARPDLAATSPAVQSILESIQKPPIFVPPGSQGTGPGKDPKPGPPPASGSGLPDIGKAVKQLTEFEFITKAGTFKINLPTKATAAFKGRLANSKYVRINFEAKVAGTFSASISIDGVPVELKGQVDAKNQTVSVSLRIFGSTGACQTSVPSDAIDKINDAGKKISDLFAKKAADEAIKKPDPKPDALQQAANEIGDFVQPEIDIGKAVAAFAEAVQAVEDMKKGSCKKGKIEFGLGGTFPYGKPGDGSGPQLSPFVGGVLKGEF